MKKALIRSGAIAVSAAVAPAALAAGYTEGTDAGNSKALSTLVSGFAAGETISGTVTGTSTDIDYYRVLTAVNPVKNIYLHSVSVSAGAGVSVSTRGLQWNGPGAAPGGVSVAASDVQMLSGRANGESIKWYGFGNGGGQTLRVAKSTSGAGTYTLTHSITTVAMQNSTIIATPGTYSLATRYVGDGEIFLYDSTFTLVGQNDNQSSYSATGNSAEIKFANLALGTYYVAIGNGNVSTNNPGVTTAGSSFLESAIAAGQTWGGIQGEADTLARPSNVSQSVSSFSDYSLYINGTKLTQTSTVLGQELAWYQITVVPTPGALALMGMGAVIAGRRRR